MSRTRSVEELRRFLTDYAALATQQPDRDVLRTLVTNHTPSEQIEPAPSTS